MQPEPWIKVSVFYRIIALCCTNWISNSNEVTTHNIAARQLIDFSWKFNFSLFVTYTLVWYRYKVWRNAWPIDWPLRYAGSPCDAQLFLSKLHVPISIVHGDRCCLPLDLYASVCIKNTGNQRETVSYATEISQLINSHIFDQQINATGQNIAQILRSKWKLDHAFVLPERHSYIHVLRQRTVLLGTVHFALYSRTDRCVFMFFKCQRNTTINKLFSSANSTWNITVGNCCRFVGTGCNCKNSNIAIACICGRTEFGNYRYERAWGKPSKGVGQKTRVKYKTLIY